MKIRPRNKSGGWVRRGNRRQTADVFIDFDGSEEKEDEEEEEMKEEG